MDICNLPRGRGKTSYLIYRSHITNLPILCVSKVHQKAIKEMADNLQLSIPDPMTISEYMNDCIYTNTKEKPNKVLIDEALLVLSQLVNTDIDTVTFSEYK